MNKKVIAGMFAAALSFAAFSSSSAVASPLVAVQAVQAVGVDRTVADVHQVQRRYHNRGRHYRGGHRHYRHHRRGYGAHHAPAPRRYHYGSSHVNWCYNRYRSYRSSDNTFQPYGGPRRQCRSPYI